MFGRALSGWSNNGDSDQKKMIRGFIDIAAASAGLLQAFRARENKNQTYPLFEALRDFCPNGGVNPDFSRFETAGPLYRVYQTAADTIRVAR
jgi:hypothetical protein